MAVELEFVDVEYSEKRIESDVTKQGFEKYVDYD